MKKKTKQYITVHAIDKHHKRQAKIMTRLVNEYIAKHEEQIFTAVYERWKNEVLYGTSITKFPSDSAGGTD